MACPWCYVGWKRLKRGLDKFNFRREDVTFEVIDIAHAKRTRNMNVQLRPIYFVFYFLFGAIFVYLSRANEHAQLHWHGYNCSYFVNPCFVKLISRFVFERSAKIYVCARVGLWVRTCVLVFAFIYGMHTMPVCPNQSVSFFFLHL